MSFERVNRVKQLSERQVPIRYVITLILFFTLVGLFIWGYGYHLRSSPFEKIEAKVTMLSEPQWLANIYGRGESSLNQPRNVFVHGQKIYVSDTGNHQVVVYDYNGKFLFEFGDSRGHKPLLMYPYGLTVVKNEILVCDLGVNKVLVFDLEGKFKKYFSTKLARPVNVVYHEKKLFFLDIADQQVVVTDTAGKELKRIGKPGRSKPGELSFPNGLTVSADGRIIVADTGNGKVQVFDVQGKFLKTLPVDQENENNIFVAPTGVSVDKEGKIYVADSMTRSVSIIDKNGKLINNLQYAGPTGQTDKLAIPTGLCLDNNQRLFIADNGASRVVIYDLK